MAIHNVDECKIDLAMERSDSSASKISHDRCRMTKKKLGQPFEDFWDMVWKLGKDDPRRVIHAMKVGLALSLVSLFYLMEPLFNGVGDNAIWAIMTVVVVFEFTAGATLSKGLNRGLGTVVAGSLAVSVGYLAEKASKIGEATVIGSSCFVLGAAATFFRFFPKIKNKYDYGVVIFLLTFNMIIVSGYRVENIFAMAYERLSTIAIGSAVSMVISLFICPIWAGEDLHYSTVKRIHALADSLEGCLMQYLDGSQYDGISEGKIEEGYKAVLESKASEESLATFASWEPPHGKFGFRHPWKQYVKVGGMVRHMAYCVVALHGCLHSKKQAPNSNQLSFKNPFAHQVGKDVAEILHELAESIKDMKQCRPREALMESLYVAVEEMHTSFCFLPRICYQIQSLYNPHQSPLEGTNIHVNPTHQSSQTMEASPQHHKLIQGLKDNAHVNTSIETNGKEDCNSESTYVDMKEQGPTVNGVEENHVMLVVDKYKTSFSEAVPLAMFASLLIEIVARLELVIESVQDLGKLGGFKS
ncbi:hypothetical protein SUGI_0806610 [Cryptomeria japonica]|uniref:aluminum-activated malate transporter 14 n=1 Tax=Cryptomeria japonica TaxID=3369 RepID=UPI0024148A9E|nr:aluminum-activated malate transporter 14 [Cryptomeria japonica]GLJ39485.1 hypothetical protein SUGI_0806610 [Cryptomeria japonica]